MTRQRNEMSSMQQYRACIWCQAPYLPKNNWQKTCSYKCSYSCRNAKVKRLETNQNQCARCGESLISKRANAIYCSKTCKSMDHNFKHRGTDAKRVQTARRLEIAKRDKFTCYLCSQVLEFKNIEIDHLIPRSRGGTSAKANLAVSCQPCNRSRGNRIDVEQLLMLTELRLIYDH